MHRARALVALVLVVAGCGDDDDEAPPDSSLLAAIEVALCESWGPVGSIPIDGKIYDLSDCP